jgi:uncharacterized protein
LSQLLTPYALARALITDLKTHRQVFFILAYVAVAITLVEYWFLPFRLRQLFPALLPSVAPHWWGVLVPQAWWIGGTTLLWVIVPLLIARASGTKVGALGLSAGKLRSAGWVYLCLFLIMLPAVVWASTQPGFLATYPLMRPNQAVNWSWLTLGLFWVMYATQFFAVEFFFRGFIAFSLEKHFGLAAIAVATVPYCLIHLHKPLPEALGAIAAGFLLGWLAIKTRSIWGGFALHVSIALSMDALALWRLGAFPLRLLPQ